MLPPVEAATLAANPKFEALYNDLSCSRINPDGTSRLLDPKALKDREAFSEELHKAHKDAEQKRLVQNGLQNLATRANDLPDDLRELSAIVLAVLRHEISDEDKEIIEQEVQKFKKEDKIKPIAKVFSKQIQSDAHQLATLLHPEDTSPNITTLPDTIATIRSEITTSRQTLASTRLTLGNEIHTIHDLYRQVLETSIRLLEQTIHGSVSRSTRAKADYITTVAEGMARKLGVQHAQLLQQVYTPEMQSLLKVKIGAMEQQKIALRRKIREMEEELERYRGVKGAEGMSREYAEIVRETERVRGEIGRLKDGSQ